MKSENTQMQFTQSHINSIQTQQPSGRSIESRNYNAWQRRERNRQYVYDYLKKNPCVDCGETRIPTLQFDHVEPYVKSFEITKGVHNRRGLKSLQEEMDKCVIRCANCHAMKTARDYGWYVRLNTDNEVV